MSIVNFLRKYSYEEIGELLNAQNARPFNGIIRIIEDSGSWNGEFNIEKGYFLTTNKYSDPQKAQDYNAITYTPAFENEFPVGNDDIELKSPMGGIEPSRVWPVWGHHGGGFEIVLTKGILQRSNSTSIGEYKSDEYNMESSKAFDMKYFVNNYMKLKILWLNEKREKNEKVFSNGPFFIIKNGYIASMWEISDSGKSYSISCGIKQSVDKLYVKFWGYVWIDNGDALIRHLSNEISITYGFNEIYVKVLKDRDRFNNTIEGIIKQLTNEELINQIIVPSLTDLI